MKKKKNGLIKQKLPSQINFNFHKKTINNKIPGINPKMGGGRWNAQEKAHQQALLEIHKLLNKSPDPKAMYKKFEAHFNATLPKNDREQVLRIIAGRSGIKFKIREKPSEEVLLHLLFGKPMPTKKPKMLDFFKAK